MVTEELSAEAHAEREAAVQSAIAGISSAIVASHTPLQEPEDARVLDAIRTLDDALSLSAVLDTLVARASREASRAGVLLVRTDRLRGWRDEGSIDGSLAEADIVAEAVRTRQAASTRAAGTTPWFTGAAVGAELHAFPLSLQRDVVAVLYTEGGNPVTLEILARHAARVLESLTAFKAARAVAGAPSVAEARATAEISAPAGDDETAARRYAQLLVSEIKLYHSDAVEAGQRERDLSDRLGGEIARARSLYGARVPAHVLHAADYFRDELVRTLAGGDASLLVDVSAA